MFGADLAERLPVAGPEFGRQIPPLEDGPVGHIGNEDRRREAQAGEEVLIHERSGVARNGPTFSISGPSG